jgi:hypothetical protein
MASPFSRFALTYLLSQQMPDEKLSLLLNEKKGGFSAAFDA